MYKEAIQFKNLINVKNLKQKVLKPYFWTGISCYENKHVFR